MSSYKIDYQISGSSGDFTVELRKSETVINSQIITQSGVTSTFYDLEYDVVDYNISVTDQCGNLSTYYFDTLRPLEIGDFNADVWVTKLLPNGKYVLAGKFTTYVRSGETTNSQRIIILNSDGSVFKSFPNGFTGGLNNSIPPQIVETGATENNTTYTIITDIYVDEPNNELIIIGNYTYYNDVEYRGIIKIDYNGAVNTNFSVSGPNGGCDGEPVSNTHNAMQFICDIDNNNLIIGGQFSKYRTVIVNDVCKISKTNGSLDNSFISPFAPEKSYRCGAYYNGIIYLGGEFNGQTYGGKSYYNMIALNVNNGSVANDFIGGGTEYGFTTNAGQPAIYSIIIWNNKLIIGGNFATYRYNNQVYDQYKISSLNLDGSLNLDFNNGGGNGYGITHSSSYWLVRYLHVDVNNKLYVCGQIDNYNGNTNVLSFIRLNDNGVLDNTFLGNEICFQGTTPITVRSVIDVGNSKILVGGAFTGYKNPVDDVIKNTNNIILLNNNGTVI